MFLRFSNFSLYFRTQKLQTNGTYKFLNQLNFKYFSTLNPKYPKVNMYEQ